MALPEALSEALRLQIGGCRHFGSPLYATLLEHILDDCRTGGPCMRVLGNFEGDPRRAFLPLRFLAGVHALALSGKAPALARHYPTLGGATEKPGLWRAFRAVVAAHPDALHAALENFPQTNEVQRSAGLLGGFLEIAQRFGLPLRLREIGASAGLNLFWDQVRYELGPHRFGTAKTPLCLEAGWRGPPARFDVTPRIESRAGCDLAPIQIKDPASRRRLESYIWPDQPERLERLRAAIAIAHKGRFRLDAARASDWLPAELVAAPGLARVLFHSSLWLYLPPPEREAIRALLETLGQSATFESPLAWLRHEDSDAKPGQMELLLQTWPGSGVEKLADGHPHGAHIYWRSGASLA